MSKILITGNGFDLFHHLPTKYHHFISIMETIENFGFKKEVSFEDLFGRVFKDKYLGDFDSIIDNYNVDKIKFDNSRIKEIDNLLNNNLWYKYFKKVCEIDTWIDFEIEVGNILNQVSILLSSETLETKKNNQFKDVSINYSDFTLFDIIEFKFDNKEIISISEKYLDTRNRKIKSKDLFSDLAKSFECFIMIFNRYLVDIVSLFYAEIKHKKDMPFELMNEIYTFNYTPTLEKLYNVAKSKVVYLHGEINEDCRKQNLVLGVSEISDDIKINKVYDFTKYYQKIIKNCNKKFIEIPSDNQGYDEETFFYVIGHSLDKSDKEYVLDLFRFLEHDKLNKSKICIFYCDNKDRQSKIRNLLSVVEEKIVSKMNRENRLCFVELNEENIREEFEKQTYKHHIIF